MIHFAIGTKAQLIKTAPVMKRLCERGMAYRYIDLGQHRKTTERLRQVFHLRAPDVSLTLVGSGNVASVQDAARWMAHLLGKICRNRREVFQSLFAGLPGVCVIHGDTLSTLLGLIAAKRAGMKVCHLEAGLRSRNWLHPFPEELVRLVCMTYADHLAAPSDWAHQNLIASGYGAKAFRMSGNTGLDAVTDMLTRGPEPAPVGPPYAVVSIHRFETIMRRKRLETLVRFLVEVASQLPVRFVVHEPTARRLRRYGLMSMLQKNAIALLPGLDYPEFLSLIQTAAFVLTDGGSVQEECVYLGIPCLLFRKHTERPDGLGANVCLSGFDPDTLRAFVRDYQQYRRAPALAEIRPSDGVIDYLVAAGYTEP